MDDNSLPTSKWQRRLDELSTGAKHTHSTGDVVVGENKQGPKGICQGILGIENVLYASVKGLLVLSDDGGIDPLLSSVASGILDKMNETIK